MVGATSDGTPACAKFKIAIKPEEDFCAWHVNENATTCALCGSPENIILYNFEDEFVPVCQNHAKQLISCKTCMHGKICGFTSDRSEPQVVTKTVRQGGMIMQMQVKNPKLVEKHCNSCYCSVSSETSNDIVCCKDSNGDSCPHWALDSSLLT